MSKNAAALAKKNEGNTFFKNKDYKNAIEKYTEAINIDNSDVTFFSNRSACFAALNRWEEAAEDGKQCTLVDKKFIKGYFRAALGYQNLENYDLALDFIKRGLAIEPSNADLKKMNREIDDNIRMKKVESAIAAAKSQLAANDIPGAHRTVDMALRLDPTNKTLNAMMDDIRPKFEKHEKLRVSGMSKQEVLKEEGDKKFKNAEFESAIASYTKALDIISDKSSELALKCYGNRAACYKQLSNFEATIADCTHVLEYKPGDVKSLVRRAQAFEAVERYKLAIQDVREVLQCGVDTVGKTTYDLCNGMQHRLTRVIQQLKL